MANYETKNKISSPKLSQRAQFENVYSISFPDVVLKCMYALNVKKAWFSAVFTQQIWVYKYHKHQNCYRTLNFK